MRWDILERFCESHDQIHIFKISFRLLCGNILSRGQEWKKGRWVIQERDAVGFAQHGNDENRKKVTNLGCSMEVGGIGLANGLDVGRWKSKARMIPRVLPEQMGWWWDYLQTRRDWRGAGLGEGHGRGKQPGTVINCVKYAVRYTSLEPQSEVLAFKNINSGHSPAEVQHAEIKEKNQSQQRSWENVGERQEDNRECCHWSQGNKSISRRKPSCAPKCCSRDCWLSPVLIFPILLLLTGIVEF